MEKIGKLLGLCVLIMIFLSFSLVITNYFFNAVFIQAQELIIYLHAFIFMLGIVYAFHHNKHVRIDIFFQKFNSFTQNKVNFIGTIILLLPLFTFIIYSSFSYVIDSWKILEGSPETGGLPFVYLLKSLLLIMPISMIAYSIQKLFRKD